MKNQNAGFTLIEVLITIAILGILTAIVIPSHNHSTAKARRTDAKIALLESASSLEKCFVINNQYNHASCTSYPASGADVVYSAEGHYKVVATNLTATSFTLTASPADSSPQTNDSHCASFSISSSGVKNATSPDCW
jgi:type IV pilus assembly protein PilE